MTVCDARRVELSRNLPVEFDPSPPKDQSCPSANALKHGPDSEVTRVPEDADAIYDRSKLWNGGLHARNAFHAWLVDQISITTLRIERNARIERRQRDRVAARAVLYWDDDRQLEAEIIGGELEDDPAATVNRLRRTPQGCDWLLDRWARLAYLAGTESGWDEPQKALAFGLLGVAPGDRTGEPGLRIDLDGRPIGPVDDPAALARREVAALLKRREEVAGQDRIDRTLAEADLSDETTPEARSIRRYDRILHDRLKWIVRQLQFESPREGTSMALWPYFNRQTEPTPEPAPTVVVPTPDEPEPEPVPEPPVSDSVRPLTRVEARLQRADRRRAARAHRRNRRRE